MGIKNFILNSDVFGLSQDFNRAVLNGYNNGFLKSASITANGMAFEAAVNEILPECQKLSVGVHLNLTRGKAFTKCDLLADEAQNFKYNFFSLLLKIKKPGIMRQIEKELRAQIEKVCLVLKPSHLDSISHIHAIPGIFEITCKLAKEYNIPYVRTHYEELYFVPDFMLNLNLVCPWNTAKIILLNYLTLKNKKIIKQYELKTNDYLIGAGYSGMMSGKALEAGLKTLSDEDNFTVEAFIHPASYLRNTDDYHSREFKFTQDKLLEDTIYRMGYDIIGHKGL